MLIWRILAVAQFAQSLLPVQVLKDWIFCGSIFLQCGTVKGWPGGERFLEKSFPRQLIQIQIQTTWVHIWLGPYFLQSVQTTSFSICVGLVSPKEPMLCDSYLQSWFRYSRQKSKLNAEMQSLDNSANCVRSPNNREPTRNFVHSSEPTGRTEPSQIENGHMEWNSRHQRGREVNWIDLNEAGKKSLQRWANRFINRPSRVLNSNCLPDLPDLTVSHATMNN